MRRSSSATKQDETALTAFRRYLEMLSMARHFTIATDTATGLAARLAGVGSPVHEGTEKALAELRARLAKTAAYLQTFSPESIDGTEEKAIVTNGADKETSYSGMQFLLGHALPNRAP